MESIIYLHKIKFGKRTFYINGMEQKVWYDNLYTDSSSDTIAVKFGSLLSESIDKLGGSGSCNCWFNKSNWGFELENERYFAWSMGTYVIVCDKKNNTYSRICKGFKPKKTIEDTIDKIIKDRLKKGKRCV